MNSRFKKKARRIYYTLKKVTGLSNELRFLFRKKYAVFKPVFIIGCGRSGTTILGKSLAQHPSICYLNERRDLWHNAYPDLDIWSGGKKNPKLFADETDCDNIRTKKLRKLFFREQVVANKDILLEKLPINNFRLRYLKACFPDAKYIYLHRNGLEVAQSISKKVVNGWFGHKNLKLDLLLKFGQQSGLDITKMDLLSDFHKGLFEWRLSIEQSDNFFKELETEKYISLSYQDYVDKPFESIEKIFNFLELKSDADMIQKICIGIERQTKRISEINDSLTLKIGGRFLERTINNHYFPTQILLKN